MAVGLTTSWRHAPERSASPVGLLIRLAARNRKGGRFMTALWFLHHPAPGGAPYPACDPVLVPDSSRLFRRRGYTGPPARPQLPGHLRRH